MKKPKKHKELSAEKMKRYLNNHLSYRERHFIESNALNNAFQRDALDGFEENPEVVWHNVKLDLHRRLAQRLYKEKHQFMLLTLRRWAAIFILLFTASTLYWFLEQQQREKISEVAEASPLSEKDTMSRDAAMSFSTDTLNATISAKSFQESSSRLAISAKKDAWSAFVRQHLRYPPEALAQKVEGIVKLRFQTDKDGKAFNIEIVQSLDESCHREAIRLVRAYTWDKNQQREEEIVFQLPR